MEVYYATTYNSWENQQILIGVYSTLGKLKESYRSP